MQATLDITETGRDARGVYALAKASLWVDGKRIYEASNVGMRIIEVRKVTLSRWMMKSSTLARIPGSTTTALPGPHRSCQ